MKKFAFAIMALLLCALFVDAGLFRQRIIVGRNRVAIRGFHRGLPAQQIVINQGYAQPQQIVVNRQRVVYQQPQQIVVRQRVVYQQPQQIVVQQPVVYQQPQQIVVRRQQVVYQPQPQQIILQENAQPNYQNVVTGQLGTCNQPQQIQAQPSCQGIQVSPN